MSNFRSKTFTSSGWFRVPAGVTEISVDVKADRDLYTFDSVATGFSSGAGLRSGVVYIWGVGSAGRLGLGDTANRSTPTRVVNESSFSAIVGSAISGSTFLALKSDGRVFGWGSNNSAQLGNGTTIDRSTPTQVINESAFKSISQGNGYVLALKSDGRVFSWGFNSSGQLGISFTTNRSSPVQVVNESDFMQIAASDSTSYALKSDGRIFAWGNGSDGRLGDNLNGNRATPFQVVNESGFKAIAATSGSCIALKSDGRIFTWGINATGELGVGDITGRSTPTQVINESDFKLIAGGGNTSSGGITMALKSDGRLFSWGNNQQGYLGTGDIINRSTPVQVINESSFASVSVNQSFILALKSDGRLFTWGIGGLNFGFPSVSATDTTVPINFSDTVKETGIVLSVNPNELIFIKQIANTFSIQRDGISLYGGIGSSLVLSW
jgi:alpha-tubulin suppressor-like RCC1 family protein